MPNTVSVADYLTIDIACRHTSIQRSVIADYFDITVNALNARLRTCTDRLRPFPDFLAHGLKLLEDLRRLRPELEGKVYPIWRLSQCLADNFRDGVLDEELERLKQQAGKFHEFFLKTNFTIDGLIPTEKPQKETREKLEEEEAALKEASFHKKRKLEAGSTPASSIALAHNETPISSQDLQVPSAVQVNEEVRETTRENVQVNDQPEVSKDDVQALPTTTEKTGGKGSRSEPYSQHELCMIYIARKIRMLDWDTISWALTRFKTPTVAVLSDARASFDQYHDIILETLKLCCWPGDSMHLIACAAKECLAALERGSWAEEVKGFKSNRGVLYHIYMQRKLERIFRKSFETPDGKRRRRRRERLLGYEALSLEDWERLPPKKKAGVQVSTGAVTKVGKKKRTKEEIQQAAEDKAAARAMLKANGLKANGEVITERRKPVVQEDVKNESVQPIADAKVVAVPVKQETRSKRPATDKDEKPRKAPRRKYDIPERERVAFARDLPADRRINYDLKLEDQQLLHRYEVDADEQRIQTSRRSPEENFRQDQYHDLTRDFTPNQAKRDTSSNACGKDSRDRWSGQENRLQAPEIGYTPRHSPVNLESNLSGNYHDSAEFAGHKRRKKHYADIIDNERNHVQITPDRTSFQDRGSSATHMSITSLVDGNKYASTNIPVRHHVSGVTNITPRKLGPAAGLNGTPASPADRSPLNGTPVAKSRSSMSLASLLN